MNQTKQPYNQSLRYCSIRAKTLDEILDALDRNIANTYLMKLDMQIEEDITEKDEFYCNMITCMMQDLKEDLRDIISMKYAD